MPKYIINKSNRYTSDPYFGYICSEVDVKGGKTYTDCDEAIKDAEKLSSYGAAKFKVIDLQEVLDREAYDRQQNNAANKI